MAQVDISSMEALRQFVQQQSETISTPAIIALYGNLGTGKTTFTQEFARQNGLTEAVTSPTYSIANVYVDPNLKLNHLDLYRLSSLDEAYQLGIEDFLNPEQFTVIEWPEIIEDILPDETIKFYFSLSDGKRMISYE